MLAGPAVQLKLGTNLARQASTAMGPVWLYCLPWPSRTLCLCNAAVLQVDRCVSLLMESGRLPEAALFARSYTPSRMKGPIEVSARTD